MRTTRANRPWAGLLLAVLYLFTTAVAAQERQWPTRESLPEPVVLVLKLLDAAHARPSTGVVISADGLVLVPADFVSAGDELLVLDGGTDVFRNGRPARTVYRSAEAGIAVLSVAGLRRQPALLGQAPVTGTVHLAAFPAAEQLTAGALPLWVSVESGAPPADLPALPGPLLDRCGHIVAYALGDESRRRIDLDTLTRTLTGFGLSLPTAACGAVPISEPDAVGDEPAVSSSQVIVANAEAPSADPQPESIDLTDDAAGDTTVADMTALADVGAPPKTDPGMPPETRQAFAITTATALGILAWWWFRWRPRSPRASKEPDTIEMLPARATRVEQAAAVAPETLEGPGLHARLPDGRVSEYRLPAQAPYSLTVGRSGDVVIDHPSLSREHVRIEGDEQGLWVSDLVSTNGTLLGRVPCLPGEVMRWSPGITLLLGEVAVHIVDGSGES